jgi:hypothetical protein
VVNCDGVIVDSCFGALLKTGNFTLVKKEASEKLVIAGTVVIIYKVVTLIKMGKETSKTLTELPVNPFPTVVKEPIRGWTPLVRGLLVNVVRMLFFCNCDPYRIPSSNLYSPVGLTTLRTAS